MKDVKKPEFVSDSKDIGDKILELPLIDVLANVRELIEVYGKNAIRLEPRDDETPLDRQIRIVFLREETAKEKRERLYWEKYWALTEDERRAFDRREMNKRSRRNAKAIEKRERKMYEKLKKKYGRR